MSEEEFAEQQGLLARAIEDSSLPDMHFNGFINALGNGDVLIVLMRHGKPIAKLSASFTVAKTLSQKLGELITDLEERTKNTIMTVDDVKDAAGQGAPKP